MSHFTVIVVGDDIDEQMEPYAEQDVDEQYLVFRDKEDEYAKEFVSLEFDVVVLADGSMYSKYDKMFLTRKSGSYSDEYVYPAGSKIRTGTPNEVYKNLEEFASKWYGHKSRDEKTGRFGDWYNPNAKWDWYSIGGRWTGYFKPKVGAEGELGRSGAFGNKPKAGWVDSLKVGDIDFEGMKEDAITEANKTYDKLDEVLKGRDLPSWTAIREKHGDNIDAARSEYNNLEVVNDLNRADFFIMGDFVEVFGPNRDAYVQRCADSVAVPFAILKEGKWYEKGEMGWFGMSHNEMTQEQWNKQFWEMINVLPSDTVLTLVDCHI